MAFGKTCARGVALVLATIGLEAPLAAGRGLAGERKGSLRSGVDVEAWQQELNEAMGEALGCGGQVSEERLSAIERALLPIWRALPKTSEGRAERRSLRYLVHRHFSRASQLHIRGFEPTRALNASGWSDADILSQRVPAFVESVLASKHRTERGFDLRDAALVVATLDQLIFDAESALLEKVYSQQRWSVKASLDTSALGGILESYMVHWMMGNDSASIRALLSNRSLLESAFPHWGELAVFTRGERAAVDFRRQRAPTQAARAGLSRPGHNGLSSGYSFEDAHSIVGGITRSFGSYWESECSSMKSALVAMDTHHTGRVPMSKFYGTGMGEDWRFGESESYLRELGALDESSALLGKQVIIPNYIQAASNCIVSAPHYLVCCTNDCEEILGEIEQAVGAPVAEPAVLLEIVGNMSSHTDLDSEEVMVRLGSGSGSLTAQLEQIAATHGGQVPLHGRLFAQWLHYAFPRECPFPHKAGDASALTPAEFGRGFVASESEMKMHTSANASSPMNVTMGREELQWMSQWSEEEELIADYRASGLSARWGSVGSLAWRLGALLVVGGLVGALGLGGRKGVAGSVLLPTHSKSHYV